MRMGGEEESREGRQGALPVESWRPAVDALLLSPPHRPLPILQPLQPVPALCTLPPSSRSAPCSRPPAAVLSALGRTLQFELAVGLNGRVWVDAPRCGPLPARGCCQRGPACLPACLPAGGQQFVFAAAWQSLQLLGSARTETACRRCHSPLSCCSPGTVVTVINAIQSSEFLSPAQQEALVAALTKGGGAAAAAAQRQQQIEQQLQQHQQQVAVAAAAAANAGGE